MNRITQLFEIEFPIIQGGMIWCSGWQLAAAVSNAGALGLIGSGSMNPETLLVHIQKCKAATQKPFGVNIPLIFPYAEEFIQIVIQEKIPVVFTSAGNPAKWTPLLKDQGIKVIHVVPGKRLAEKCQTAGVDAIVAEGFEAGGHNGREETTTMTLIPMIKEIVDIPVIAAGGIATGQGMLAAFALGAEGIQMGSRFVASEESSAHPAFKQKVMEAGEGQTFLSLKKLTPVRLLQNSFFEKVHEMENRGASAEELTAYLGHGRSKSGMFDGNLTEGELEIGQISSILHQILPAKEIIRQVIHDFEQTRLRLVNFKF